MRLIRLKAPGGLQNLRVNEEDCPQPGPRDLLVRIRACSLNFHDDLVVTGKFPSADGRVPMTDGAGDVVAVGSEVTGFKVDDKVVSTFFPDWLTGEAAPPLLRAIPGDTIDGYAAEYVCMREHAFTRVPAGFSHAEAATLPCAAVTAWRGLVTCGQVKPGDTVLTLGTSAVSLSSSPKPRAPASSRHPPPEQSWRGSAAWAPTT